MDTPFAVHISKGDDGSYVVVMCIDGFNTEVSAEEFVRTLLLDGRLAIGDVEFVTEFNLQSIH
jgi:hypothetical protein